MAFIIDTYNKYNAWDRAHATYQFEINEQWYAVFEVEMEWGLPKVQSYVDRDKDPKQYFIYNTKADAMRFVQQMKSLN